VKLAGVVDLDAPQFNVEPGCKVGSAKYFCAPAEKTFVSATNKATGLPIVPLPIYGGPDGTFDRICYKVKCPSPSRRPTRTSPTSSATARSPSSRPRCSARRL
jgi:hypothetical protein